MYMLNRSHRGLRCISHVSNGISLFFFLGILKMGKITLSSLYKYNEMYLCENECVAALPHYALFNLLKPGSFLAQAIIWTSSLSAMLVSRVIMVTSV